MAKSIRTFLMFEGKAEEAIRLYLALFPTGSELRKVEHWMAGEPGREGSLKRGELSLRGHDLIAFDSPAHHEFTFTPAVSLFVECESEAELDATFAKLSEGGRVLMPLGSYGFSTKFGWTDDRYGVSWQLNLA